MDKGDAGTFKRIIEQLKRKSIKMPDIMLINKYGKVLEIEYRHLGNDVYKQKIRGFF